VAGPEPVRPGLSAALAALYELRLLVVVHDCAPGIARLMLTACDDAIHALHVERGDYCDGSCRRCDARARVRAEDRDVEHGIEAARQVAAQRGMYQDEQAIE